MNKKDETNKRTAGKSGSFSEHRNLEKRDELIDDIQLDLYLTVCILLYLKTTRVPCPSDDANEFEAKRRDHGCNTDNNGYV